MSIFIVKTISDRNLAIEADRFNFTAGKYEFWKKENGSHKIVASVPEDNVFAVLEEEVESGDYYFSDHEIDDKFNAGNDLFDEGAESEDDEHDSTCLDCRFDAFLESRQFFDAVADAFYTLTEPEPLKVELRSVNGITEYGFVTPKGWVGFRSAKNGSKTIAEQSAADYDPEDTGWYYIPVEETKVIQ